LFLDDTSFSYSNRDELQKKTVIDHDLKELDEWSKKLLMSFNPDTTEIMLFSNTDIPEFNFTSYSESGLVPSPSLFQNHVLTGMTSFEVYVSDVILAVDLRK
jgi:hypothetical protein